jgi:outer membrane murein-binding lipoprotein Lpp
MFPGTTVAGLVMVGVGSIMGATCPQPPSETMQKLDQLSTQISALDTEMDQLSNAINGLSGQITNSSSFANYKQIDND